MSALSSYGCGVHRPGAGVAALPMQGLRSHVQRGDGHAVVGLAPQGAVAFVRRVAIRGGDGAGVGGAAGRCGVAASTAFRWRHRFLRAVAKTPKTLRGIVEADETFVLRSRKGARKPDRKPRRRGGKAASRGLSREQVPVLVAADRGGGHASAALPAVSADALKKALAPVIETDIVPVSDANRAYRPCAAGARRAS